MPRDGSAKSVLQESMWLKTQGDVGCVRNIVLVAIRIRLQRKWNALSVILPLSLIKIWRFVFLNASKRTLNIIRRQSNAVNALCTSHIQLELRSASLVISKIVWIAFILFAIIILLNVSSVIIQQRWTIKQWLAELCATQQPSSTMSPIHVINARQNSCSILFLKNA